MDEESFAKTELEEEIRRLFSPLAALMDPSSPQTAVALIKRPAGPGDVDRVIDQSIYGLLSKAELTSNELTLLAALMRGRKK